MRHSTFSIQSVLTRVFFSLRSVLSILFAAVTVSQTSFDTAWTTVSLVMIVIVFDCVCVYIYKRALGIYITGLFSDMNILG